MKQIEYQIKQPGHSQTKWIFIFFRRIIEVFDGLGDSSGVLTFKNNRWKSTANIISFPFPCIHQYCNLILNGSLSYWLTKIPTGLKILNKEITINWPVNSECTLMTNTIICGNDVHLQDPNKQQINISITEISYTGYFSSHHMNYGGKFN